MGDGTIAGERPSQQCKAILIGSISRVDCPEHGVKTVTLTWALPHRRFTILFERFAIEVLLMTQTVQATMNQLLLAITLSLVPTLTLHAQLLGPPTSVKELWEDFDPRREPLDPQIVRQWEKDGVVFRYVTFHVGSFKNSSARLGIRDPQAIGSTRGESDREVPMAIETGRDRNVDRSS